MKSLPERIMRYAEAEPEGTPIQAENLLHLGVERGVRDRARRLGEKALTVEDVAPLLEGATDVPEDLRELLLDLDEFRKSHPEEIARAR